MTSLSLFDMELDDEIKELDTPLFFEKIEQELK